MPNGIAMVTTKATLLPFIGNRPARTAEPIITSGFYRSAISAHQVHNDEDNRDRMATRQEGIDAFTHQGVPPAAQPLGILCEDHVGTYCSVFVPME